MAFMYRPVTFPFWFFILPSLLVICGVVICILGAEKVGEVMVIITGISLIVYAASTFINIIGLVSYRRAINKKAAESAESAEPEYAVTVEPAEIAAPADETNE